MDKKVTTSEIIIMASGAVMLIASFLPWLSVDEIDESWSAWSGDAFFPLSWLPMLFGVLMAVHVALSRFAGTKFPEPVVGFTWRQIHLALAAFAVLLMLAWLIVDTQSADKGIGFWLTVLGAIGLLVGAIMMQQEPETATTRPGTAPPTPF